jgi:Zn-dependent protease
MLGWSINLFRVRGIMISLNFTFFPLLAWAAYSGWRENGIPGLWWEVGFLVAIFVCIILHEFGHAFMAMGFGIRVRSVLVTCVGGIALLDSIPKRPVQEFLIAIAGPAVNVAIAAVLWMAVGPPEDWNSFSMSTPLDAVRLLIEANVILLLFNLIPAFPMDGGRILRSILATMMPYVRATFWAVTVAKVLLVVGVLACLYFGNLWRALIFGFLFSAGEAEYRAVKRQAEEDTQWRESMVRTIATPPPDALL